MLLVNAISTILSCDEDEKDNDGRAIEASFKPHLFSGYGCLRR